MAELGVEALTRLIEVGEQSGWADPEIEYLQGSLPAIIAALEDRDRLRAAGQAWIETDEAFWRSPHTLGASSRRRQARESFRAALEGHDDLPNFTPKESLDGG